jgi:hypothetical protein
MKPSTFQPLGLTETVEACPAFRNLDRQMRGDRVGKLGIVLDLADGAETSGEIFLLSLT